MRPAPTSRLASRRRGASLVQWCVIAALVVLGIVAGVSLVGTRANTKLGQTASDMANPKNLTTRFGS